jgi:hypothetical protein
MQEHRSTRRTVVFYFPVKLDGFENELPAGTYSVESDHASLDTSFPSSVRTGTWMFVPAVGAKTGPRQMIPVKPAQLDAAIAADLKKLLGR